LRRPPSLAARRPRPRHKTLGRARRVSTHFFAHCAAGRRQRCCRHRRLANRWARVGSTPLLTRWSRKRPRSGGAGSSSRHCRAAAWRGPAGLPVSAVCIVIKGILIVVKGRFYRDEGRKSEPGRANGAELS
jgi:hypothetical protein